MTAMQAFLLGVLQGLTEFLPVSSSGHLILAERFFGLRIDPQSMQGFNILLHAGTLLALLLCYRGPWGRMILSPFRKDAASRHLLFLLLVATVPGAVMGFFFEETVARHLSSPHSVAVGFIITAVVLVVAEHADQIRRMQHLRFVHALFIGVAQALALVPGVSRSGLTIAAARALRTERRDALDFSFLLAVPIIAGATMLSIEQVRVGEIMLPDLRVVSVGFASAFVASMLSIRFLRSFVVKHNLLGFSWYLVAAGAFLLIVGV